MTQATGFVMQDWSDIPDGVPNGEYTVVLDKGTIRDGRDGTSKNLSLQLSIQDDDNPDYNGQKLFATFQIEKDGAPNKQSIPFVKRALLAFGADPDIFTGPFNLLEVVNNDLAGATAIATVTWQERNGQNFQAVRIRPES